MITGKMFGRWWDDECESKKTSKTIGIDHDYGRCEPSLSNHSRIWNISEIGAIVKSGISKGMQQPLKRGIYIYVCKKNIHIYIYYIVKCITNHNRDLE